MIFMEWILQNTDIFDEDIGVNIAHCQSLQAGSNQNAP